MKKSIIIILAVVAVLVIIRLILPSVITKVINKKLSALNGYKGHVLDVDLNLYRGAYVIDSLVIEKLEDSIPAPFLVIRELDLSVHWKALFHGRIVGEIIFNQPVVNFAVSKTGAKKKTVQDGSGVDWITTFEGLIPLRINRFEVNGGEIAYRDFTTNPKVDIQVSNLDLLITNLSNVTDRSKEYPTSLSASAKSFGDGSISIDGRMNVLKQIPDMDINLKLENVQLTKLNNFLRAYANLDAEAGVFNMYSEILVKDGVVDGYIKPLMQKVKILDWKQEDKKFFGKVWEAIAGGISELLENQPKDQIATKIPLTGNIKDIKTGVFPAIWNIFKNAFVQAFRKGLDYTIGSGEAK